MKDTKFLEKVEIAANGCWLWTGKPMPNGYGRITFRGKNEYVHRASYLVHKGDIPPGLCVCHVCDVRNCVNPEHLWLGTKQDNTNDMIAKGRANWVPLGTNLKFKLKPLTPYVASPLTAADVREIRRLYDNDLMRAVDIAKKFGVHKTTVCGIVKRRNWKNVA